MSLVGSKSGPNFLERNFQGPTLFLREKYSVRRPASFIDIQNLKVTFCKCFDMQDFAHKQISVLQTPGTRLATARSPCPTHILFAGVHEFYLRHGGSKLQPLFSGVWSSKLIHLDCYASLNNFV